VSYDINSLNDGPSDVGTQRYIYLNLPFYAPFNLQADAHTYGFGQFSMERVHQIIAASDSAYQTYISPSGANYNVYTKHLMDQIRDSQAICYEYLGARVTVRNEVTQKVEPAYDDVNIVIYGVKGLHKCEQFNPDNSGYQLLYEDLEPWGRSSFFWMVESSELLPYISDKTMKSMVDSNMFTKDDGAYRFVMAGEHRPAHRGMFPNIPILGQSAQVSMGTHFGSSFSNPGYSPNCETRAGLFSKTYGQMVEDYRYLDPLATMSGDNILSAFELLPGRFVTLEMTYDEGEYFWEIVNYGPIPGYNPLGNS
jgi:hypothetical protein